MDVSLGAATTAGLRLVLACMLAAGCATSRGAASAPSVAAKTPATPASLPAAVSERPTTPAAAAAPAAETGREAPPKVPEAPAPPPLIDGPGWSIIAAAPEGITAEDLGRPFDASFQPLAGSGPLFHAKTAENYVVFRHTASLVQDQVTLAATVRSWGLTGDASRSRRFATYRAEQIADIHAVDDMVPPGRAPQNAMYYLAKVYYGRSFEVRLAGDERQFNSNLAGIFLSGRIDGGLKSFAEKNRLEFTAIGRGLRPKSDVAIYAKQPSEIEENYTVEGSGTVPVEVEYRLIPGRQLPSQEPILWHKQTRYRVELSAIEAHRCDRTSACDLGVTVARVESGEKPKTYRGPNDSDLWEPRYMLLESTDPAELLHGFEIEVVDRNLTFASVLGRCQVRMDQVHLKGLHESAERTARWTEACGKAQIRLTVTAEDTQF